MTTTANNTSTAKVTDTTKKSIPSTSGTEATAGDQQEMITVDVGLESDTEDIDETLNSQSTVRSHRFRSKAAKGVQDEFHQQQNDRAASGLVQATIMRNVEERLSDLVPRLVQSSLSAMSQHTCFGYRPPPVNETAQYQDPPSRIHQRAQYPSGAMNQSLHNNSQNSHQQNSNQIFQNDSHAYQQHVQQQRLDANRQQRPSAPN